MNSNVNRQFHLKRYPQGLLTKDDLEYIESPIPTLSSNQALVRNLYLSVDPTQRNWMSEMEQYMPPVKLGEVMRCVGIGQIIQSHHPHYQVGDLVQGFTGWQDYFLIDDRDSSFTSLPKDLLSLTSMLSVMGITGMTAYFGLLDIGRPQPGETVVISAASGAVGSIVGQIAKIQGCRVVGITGSNEKCALLTDELGFDAAISYKDPDWKNQLQGACPDGIDLNFENVGGEIMSTVISMMNLKGRVVLCGTVSDYNAKLSGVSQGNFMPILMKRLRVEGFIILDFAPRFEEAIVQLGQWVIEGKLKYRETIVDGLENIPDVLNRLFNGDKIGKLIVKVADISNTV
jgi:NADPH-dependent curcumin reductase